MTADEDWTPHPAEGGSPTDMASPEHVRHTWSDADTLAARDTQTERNRLAREVREGRWDHRFPTLHK